MKNYMFSIKWKAQREVVPLCDPFNLWLIMLNILKDPQNGSISSLWLFPTVWMLIFDEREGSYIFSTVWIPIFDKRLASFILFYSAHMLIIKTAERYFVYYITPKLIFFVFL